MLQQTQITTVIPYYEAWLARFPTVWALANASLDEVLKQWEGLGYYSRARNLHAAAKMVVSDFDGQVPESVQELRKLKGIGAYTAGAIASIAYNKPEPILDGNVIRILSRLTDLRDDVTKSRTVKYLWRLAGELVSETRPGDFNQALMELGQLVCRPERPLCHQCPLAAQCLSRERGTQLDRPVRPPRPKTPHYDVTAGVIFGQDGRLLISRRPLDGLLGGLWEFPGGKKEEGESLKEALRREILEELGIEIEVNQHLKTIQHAYTHFRITLHTYYARHLSGQPKNLGVAEHAWVHLEELSDYAFAVTDRQIIDHLMQNGLDKRSIAVDR